MESGQQRRNAQRLITLGWGALIIAVLATIVVIVVAPHLSLSSSKFLAIPVGLIFVLIIVGIICTFLGNLSLRRL